VREGKVRHVAASNVSPERLEAAMQVSEREGLVRYVALQPHYNLVERGYENGLAGVCRRHDPAACRSSRWPRASSPASTGRAPTASLAWLAAQPTVVSPIASARTPAQLAELMAMTDFELSADELRALDEASA
jgi:aryl-alcohol dehydrogenase-like predicted oxidoreductase